MADGMIGADPDQLRDLAKTMESSGSKLKHVAASLNSVIANARWNGPDSEKFRGQWNNGMRKTLHSTGLMLAEHSNLLKVQAEEQEKTSAVDGGGQGSAGGSQAVQARVAQIHPCRVWWMPTATRSIRQVTCWPPSVEHLPATS